jgi:VanZ family protein
MRLKKMLDLVPKLALAGAVICAVVIAVLSLLPGNDLPTENLNDKLNHFIAYGVLMALVILARGQMALIGAMALTSVYGLALEGLQGIMPYGRSASWLDALANAGGVLIGAVLGTGTALLLDRLRRLDRSS